MAVIELKPRIARNASQSYGGRRRKETPVPDLPSRKRGNDILPASSLLHSNHGSMMNSLLRAPPRPAVRKYVLEELKRAGRRMDYDEIADVISCPGYDYEGRACAKHGKGNCGGFEWIEDVDAAGNTTGKWERQRDAATRYEVVVAMLLLLASETIEIVEGQIRLSRQQKPAEALTPKERWHRADEEIRLSWQTIGVKETRSVWDRDWE